jgi:hypothetical protein
MDNAASLDIWDYCAWLIIWLALFLITWLLTYKD